MTRRVTVVILAGLAALLIAWDVYVYLAAGSEATISVVLRDAAAAHPVIPFALGVIAGHILWPPPRRRVP